MRLASATASILLAIVGTAQAADAPAVIALARQRVEAEDSRGTGHLVRVDASGRRISNDFSIKVHWFPGVLRTLLEISASRKPGEATGQDTPSASCLKCDLTARIRFGSFIPASHPRLCCPLANGRRAFLAAISAMKTYCKGSPTGRFRRWSRVSPVATPLRCSGESAGRPRFIRTMQRSKHRSTIRSATPSLSKSR